MDTVKLHNIRCNAIIGTLPHERSRRQALVIDVTFCADLKPAGKSDDLMQAVDYSAVEKEVVELVSNSSFQLIEALSHAIGQTIVRKYPVEMCEVTVFKPGASKYGSGVSVTMTCRRGEDA